MKGEDVPMVAKPAKGHANITWWCGGYGRRNRSHVEMNADDRVIPCDHCLDGALDLIPPSGVTYAGSVGRSMREGAS